MLVVFSSVFALIASRNEGYRDFQDSEEHLASLSAITCLPKYQSAAREETAPRLQTAVIAHDSATTRAVVVLRFLALRGPVHA